MSKRDTQVLEVLIDHDLSTFAIAFLVFKREKFMSKGVTEKERIDQIETHLEDMARRGLVEKRLDTVAAWRTLWRKL